MEQTQALGTRKLDYNVLVDRQGEAPVLRMPDVVASTCGGNSAPMHWRT